MDENRGVSGAIRGEIERVWRALLDAEGRCARVAELPEADGDRARADLADARAAFHAIRLSLLRALDLVSLRDPVAVNVRDVIAERYRYPSASAAETILRLVDSLQPEGTNAPPHAAPGRLAEELRRAMDRRGDNKKSAAGHIPVSTKTLDRLLAGASTKPVKQQAAWRYIRNSSSSR